MCLLSNTNKIIKSIRINDGSIGIIVKLGDVKLGNLLDENHVLTILNNLFVHNMCND